MNIYRSGDVAVGVDMSAAMDIASEDRENSVSLSNVLFAMDFSPASLRAYPYAAEIALRYRGKVFVTHVVPAEDSGSIPSAEQDRLDKLLETAAAAGLSDSLGVLRETPHAVLIGHGDICAKLLAIAEEHNIDLVVIGTHGWRGIKKLLKGSTAEGISRLASAPVLTVGPRVSGRLHFKRILYATDLQPAAARALPFAISLTRKFAAELLVLHVNDQAGQESPAEAAPKTIEFLRKQSTSSLSHSILDESRVIVDFGPAADLILQHASARNVDLIVMGLHHLNVLKARIGAHLPGSTAYAVASQAPCPVLTVALPRRTDNH